jgi:hypothetical protein
MQVRGEHPAADVVRGANGVMLSLKASSAERAQFGGLRPRLAKAKKSGVNSFTPIYSKVCKPAIYGVGIAACVWFEKVLSFPVPSTAVVT